MQHLRRQQPRCRTSVHQMEAGAKWERRAGHLLLCPFANDRSWPEWMHCEWGQRVGWPAVASKAPSELETPPAKGVDWPLGEDELSFRVRPSCMSEVGACPALTRAVLAAPREAGVPDFDGHPGFRRCAAAKDSVRAHASGFVRLKSPVVNFNRV